MNNTSKSNPVDFNKLTDREILLIVYLQQCAFKEQLANHLHHHWAVTIAALTAAFMGVSSFVVGMILLLASYRIG